MFIVKNGHWSPSKLNYSQLEKKRLALTVKKRDGKGVNLLT